MYKRIVIVLWIPDIDDLTRFWVIDDSSDDTAWKNIEICSEEIRSGYEVGRAATKVKNSLNKLGISKTNACSWIYRRGTNQIKSVREAIINIKNVTIKDIFLLTLNDI